MSAFVWSKDLSMILGFPDETKESVAEAVQQAIASGTVSRVRIPAESAVINWHRLACVTVKEEQPADSMFPVWASDLATVFGE